MNLLFTSTKEVVAKLNPSDPVYCLRPQVLQKEARRFVSAFPGDVLYAVKCNDHPLLLKALYQGGIRSFDVASLREMEKIFSLFPDALCQFMHPVKSRESITEAYYRYGIRTFALDHVSELHKILDATGGARDLTLVVRLDMPKGAAKLCLGGKFGTSITEAARLLREIKNTGCRTGLTFHVGSQCVQVHAFTQAVELCGKVLEEAKIDPDVLDIGGGFPGRYIGTEPAFETIVLAVQMACRRIGLPPTCRLQCEPGRALVADGVSALVRVEMRREESLYINSGIYGGLAEVKWLGPYFPTRVFSRANAETLQEKLCGFDLFGPTCDSIDSMPGPHWLPETIREGDWIEVGRIGAYSNVLSTGFNGFNTPAWVTVMDEDILNHPAEILEAEVLSAA